MYYSNYEDYMRRVLNYKSENKNTYPIDYLENMENYEPNYRNDNELEDLYPNTYKIIYPIVCDICKNNKEKITKEILDNMVDEVYKKIETNNEIFIKINIENVPNNMNSNINRNMQNSVRRTQNVNNIRKNNPLLKDIIRILILKKLLENNPSRPPFLREQRPPIMPKSRDFDEYIKF